MEQLKCSECSYVFDKASKACPNCGCPARECETIVTSEPKDTDSPLPTASAVPTGEYRTLSQLLWSCQFHRVFREVFLEPCDFGQRIYEIFELWWECVRVTWMCVTTRFAKFNGRASRREYFSCFLSGLWILFLYLLLLPFYGALLGTLFYGSVGEIILIFIGFLIVFLVALLPWLSVSVRRMHDINRSGWWILCPIAGYFFQFKKSDEGVNRYGAPNPVMDTNKTNI